MLWKKNLNGYGKKFHQYQQNKQSHRILIHWIKKIMTYDLETQVLAWDRHKKWMG